MSDNNQIISSLDDVFTVDANGTIVSFTIDTITAGTITTTGVSNLGQIGNVRIFGGSNGQALVTAGNGSLAWANIGSGVSGITAGNGIQVANVGNNYTVSANVVDILAGTNIVVGVSDGKYTISSTGGGGGGGGTVTSVGLTAGGGIQVSGGPVTSSGNITVTNTGVTSITAGTNITVSASNGAVTISSTGGGANATPGGSNSQVQFNDGGVFSGSSGLTWNKNTATLTVTNLVATNITGTAANATHANSANTANIANQANSATNANLATFATVANSVAGANVTGAVSNALYANLAGVANVANTVNDAAQPNITSVGTLSSLTVGGTSNLGPVGNVTITGGSNGQFLQTDGGSNLSWATVSTSSISNGNANVVVDANAGVRISTGGTANVVVVNTVGTSVTGNLSIGGNITTTANASVGNLAVSGSVNLFNLSLGGNLGVSGNTGVTNITASGVSNLGAVGNVRITGGSSGQFLRTDGAGNLTWAAVSAGGGGTVTSVAVAAGSGISVSGSPVTSSGTITVTNNGVTGLFAGAGVSLTGNTGNITVTNTGVTSLVAGSGIGLNGSNGVVTISSSASQSLVNIKYGTEVVGLPTNLTGVYNYDVLNNSVQLATLTGNVTLNFRGNSTTTLDSTVSVGSSITATFLVNQGATTWQVTSLSIDGVAQTIRYVSTPIIISGTITSYTYTMIKTATNTWTVLGSYTRYA